MIFTRTPSGLVAVAFLCLLSLCVALTLAANHQSREEAQDQLIARQALAQTLGFASLAVSADCTLARSLTEGLAGCLGDVAGGYCTYSSCDVISRPDLSTDYDSRLRVVKASP